MQNAARIKGKTKKVLPFKAATLLHRTEESLGSSSTPAPIGRNHVPQQHVGDGAAANLADNSWKN